MMKATLKGNGKIFLCWVLPLDTKDKPLLLKRALGKGTADPVTDVFNVSAIAWRCQEEYLY